LKIACLFNNNASASGVVGSAPAPRWGNFRPQTLSGVQYDFQTILGPDTRLLYVNH